MFFFKPFTQFTGSITGAVFLFVMVMPCTVVAQGRTNAGFLRFVDSLAPIVFSKDQLRGWYGTYNQLPQNAGAFVWVCRYK